MNPDQTPKPTDNMELLKQQASCCGSECGCHTTGSPGKGRWVIGLVVLAVAGVMVARAITKSSGTQPAAAPSFAVESLAAAGTNSSPGAVKDETSVGTTLGALSELNSAAAQTDAVFIFLPANDGSAVPSAPLRAAARTVENGGAKCGLFTLKPGSPDYDAISKQVSVPCVLALAKGGGMVPISGDVTEAKLVQGFVAASRSGGCGSASSCAPGATGCK